MPRKRRALMGRSTSASRRMAASRAVETPEQGQVQRQEDRATHAASRAAETPEQRRSRVDDQRTRQATASASITYI
ncbi:unnamed protein product [Didymodactylos carnosus]|uniref:Uncharacterized protein n=1 Tax=Didymodactylos carnosus TaxID=1234261 RepID=A0A8S2NQM1_9BILA|nr:unnamed protein product [Didymodactylos carnosus]CAF4009753.1 unnamed protein product [Didymodactylos carnosus]